MSRYNKKKGVYYETGRHAWVARVDYYGKKIFLGYWDTEDRALEILSKVEGFIAAGVPRNMWWSSESEEESRSNHRANIYELRAAKGTIEK